MKTFNTVFLMLLLCTSLLSLAESFEDISFIEGEHQFILNKDTQKEANSWAMCSAAYSMLAKVNEPESPEYASKLNQFSNGAGIAIVMTYYMRMDTAKDGSSWNEDFARVWRHGVTMRESLIDVAATHIASNIEGHGLEVSLVKLINTVSICSDNLDAQQAFIDAWRELRESGVLT